MFQQISGIYMVVALDGIKWTYGAFPGKTTSDLLLQCRLLENANKSPSPSTLALLDWSAVSDTLAHPASHKAIPICQITKCLVSSCILTVK